MNIRIAPSGPLSPGSSLLHFATFAELSAFNADGLPEGARCTVEEEQNNGGNPTSNNIQYVLTHRPPVGNISQSVATNLVIESDSGNSWWISSPSVVFMSLVAGTATLTLLALAFGSGGANNSLLVSIQRTGVGGTPGFLDYAANQANNELTVDSSNGADTSSLIVQYHPLIRP